MSTFFQTGAGARPFGSSTGEELEVPSCTIEDVDRALFNLFDKDLSLFYEDSNKNSKRIPVIFATGERFAILRRKKPLRDKAGALILPLISILRTGVSQYSSNVGTNQAVDITIKKKLSPKDPSYQRFINKEGLKNQDDRAYEKNYIPNIDSSAPQGSGTTPGKIAKRNPSENQNSDFDSGKLISDKVSNNIYEIYTMRAPKYFTATYQVTFWSQYMQQMNNVLSALMSSYHIQNSRSFRIETDKGYYFVASFGSSFSSDLNFKEFSDDERIIKYSVEVEITGYIVNPKFPGSESSIRKYISAPQVSFDMVEVSSIPNSIPVEGVASGDPNDYILEDLKTLEDPQKASSIKKDSVTSDPEYYKTATIAGQQSGREPLKVQRFYKDKVTGEVKKQDLNLIYKNQKKGETVYREQITYDLGEIVVTPK
jgi:hypothetical protein